MKTAKRLVSTVDIDVQRPHRKGDVLIAVSHELEFSDGERIELAERGWGSTGSWTELSRRDIERTARMVVGPDEPLDRSEAEQVDLHWTALAEIAQQQGAPVEADMLRQLPHDVILTDRLLNALEADTSS